jgi:hypothetical protein
LLIGIANPHIASNSPCIDAGNTPLAAAPRDIDNEQRISGAAVDRGCDEVHYNGLTGALAVTIEYVCTDAVAGSALPFASAIEGRAQSLAWFIEGNGTVDNAITIMPAWPSPGDYDVVLTAYNADYPAGVSATVSVHIVGPFTNYVAAASAAPVAPYTSWAQAASNLQDAVDVCPCGGVILVATGVYDRGGCMAAGAGNRVALNRPVSMRAAGPVEDTLIVGVSPPGNEAKRCAYLGPGASLHGFTLTNGATDRSGDADGPVNGGGAFLDRDALISNCYVIACQAWFRGGGIVLGSACRGVKCRVTGCSGGNGGGVFCDSTALLYDSLVYGNQCYDGGGVFLYYGGNANRCVIRENIGLQAGSQPGLGAGVACINGSSLANSLVYSNYNQGVVLGGGVACLSQYTAADFMVVDNCTIVNNSASYGGGVFCTPNLGREMWATVRNTIIVDNMVENEGTNFFNDKIDAEYAYCCSQPLPPGPGSITNDPAFIDAAAGDFHQLSSSPCVDTGTNGYAALPWDLDHNHRIWDGTVDMGCYEWIPEPGTIGAVLLLWSASMFRRSRF